jgi:glycosyltransferase involved in cell wall biosynthesis
VLCGFVFGLYSFDMRIAIDARGYGWAGVGRYTRNLVYKLQEANSGHEFVLLIGKKDVLVAKEELGDDNKVIIQEIEDSYYSWREQINLLWQLNKVEADLFHFTNFNIPLFFNRPYVVTVHDITRFIFPGQTQQGLFRQVIYEQVFKRAVERAQALICVSQTTADDLWHLPLNLPKSVNVIYEGVEDKFNSSISEEDRQNIRLLVGGNDPYILYVGVWMNHKNIERLLKAFAKVRERGIKVKLVLTGKPKPKYVEADKVARLLGLGSDEVVYAGHVEEQLLPALYAEAECLVLPSLYEGFGLPALEAAACGAPVITSNVSSLPEIMGDAAEYVNPEYVSGITVAIKRLIKDKSRREELIGLGKMRAGEFSWEKCAKETLEVYEGLT